MKIDRVMVNSEFTNSAFTMDGKPLDSIDYDYNYPISLITYFTVNEPRLEIEKRDFVLFDLPKNANPDSPGWFDLHKTYTANGTEEYFSIGTFSPTDYIEILRIEKNDTSDFHHKFSRYLIRNVSIFPIIDSTYVTPTDEGNDQTSTKIADSFDFDSNYSNSNYKFIVRKVNFELSSFELTDSTKQEIDKIAFFMKENTKFDLKITGHTDSIGTNHYNQTLSEKRAIAVFQYLISRGIEKGRLMYDGKGEEEPLNDKLLKKNFRINRRVEFEFKLE